MECAIGKTSRPSGTQVTRTKQGLESFEISFNIGYRKSLNFGIIMQCACLSVYIPAFAATHCASHGGGWPG